MKHLTIVLALLFNSSLAIAAGTFYNLNDELESAYKLIQEEKYDQAIEILNRAIKSEPDNADAWNFLGYASRKNADLETSAEAYNKALAIEPEHKDALEYQGELFLMLGDKSAAEKNLAKLSSLCPDGCEQLEMLMKAIAGQE